MIKEFVDRFAANEATLRAGFEQQHPSSYKELVAAVVRAVAGPDVYESPSVDRIHEIDDGEYQGTLVYVIGAGGYQPHEYWYVKVGYGSCGGCDTLQTIRFAHDGDTPNAEQVRQYMTLATHILQGLKRMGDDDREGPYAGSPEPAT